MPERIDIDKATKNLCEVDLFCDLEPERLRKVAAVCELMRKKQGDILIREGEEADCAFILLTGEVQVRRHLELPILSASKGTDRILTKITAEGHPIVGETALLGKLLRRSSVMCSTDCMLYRIQATDLHALMEGDAVIGRSVYCRLAMMLMERLDATSIDVVKLSAALVLALEE